MTSFAFILGIVPLVNAKGAGAASRRALGTAVFGGMIAATFLAVFFVPVFFVVIQRYSESSTGVKDVESTGFVDPRQARGDPGNRGSLSANRCFAPLSGQLSAVSFQQMLRS